MQISILFWLFVLAITVQCGYALFFFTRIFYLSRKEIVERDATLPVSIVICAKNEAENLQRNLPLILSQRYINEDGKPMYEVIVVNDASDDHTEDVLEELEREYHLLRHLNIPKKTLRDLKGKKFALGKGVAEATHNFLLLTDADCVPASENWISCMTEPFEHGKEIVLGYGGYYKGKGLLNAFIQWETMHSFLQYATYTMAGKPYMGVGRNIAFTKQTFLRAAQSQVWNKLPSGDDDLLVQSCSNDTNTAIVGHRDAFTFSPAKRTWNEWLSQKQRHLSTGKYYKKSTKLLLAFYGISHVTTWVLFILLVSFEGWGLILLLMLMRCSVYWTIWQTTAIKLQQKRLFKWMAICDFGWLFYNIVLSPFIFLKNKQQWK